MRILKPGLLAAAALFFSINAAPVFAQSASNQGYSPPGGGYGRGGKGAPGPLAGAGLPFLLVAGAAGAYKLVRRRRNESRPQHDEAERH